MFFNSGNQMEQLVSKHQWEKISKKMHTADVQSRIELAKACGGSFDEDSSHTLIKLLSDDDKGVLTETIKSLGEIGGGTEKTHLLSLAERLPDSDAELIAVIRESVAKITASKRR